jgi:molybdate transport system substrate-binding protein
MRPLHITLLALAIALWGQVTGLARAEAGTHSLTVFAAASLQEVLGEEARAYKAKTGTSVRLAFAASGTLATQIAAGAPADIFISADENWMDALEKHGKIAANTRHDWLRTRLVLIAPRTSALAPLKRWSGFRINNALGQGRLAIGDPKSVPAGHYAQVALEKMGQWQVLAPHLAQAENVRAALGFVAAGNAPLGIVYETDALAEPRVKIIAYFPQNVTPAMHFPLALIAPVKNTQAYAFEHFLLSPQSAAIYKAHGFLAP